MSQTTKTIQWTFECAAVTKSVTVNGVKFTMRADMLKRRHRIAGSHHFLQALSYILCLIDEHEEMESSNVEVKRTSIVIVNMHRSISCSS